MAASPLWCQAGSKRPLIARIKNTIITSFKKIYFLKFNFAMEPLGHSKRVIFLLGIPGDKRLNPKTALKPPDD